MTLQNTGERMIPEIDSYSSVYLEHITRYFFASQFVADKVVLDIACGVGYGSSFLRDHKAQRVIGVDHSEETIDYARRVYQKKGIEFVTAEVENLPFENAFFDVIVSFETIEHLHDQTKFLYEIKRLLKPDGVLIISTPNSLVYPPGNIFHTKEFQPREFQSLLDDFFLNTKIFYQHTVLSNYILDENDLAETGSKTMLKNFKLAVQEPSKAMYLVGVASASDLPKITGVNSIFNDVEIKKTAEQIKSQQTLLQAIHTSRGWKIITFFHKLRKFIPLIREIFNRHIPNHMKLETSSKLLVLFSKLKYKSGIEIGGPSNIFRTELPIYEIVESLDNVNFSSRTTWEKDLQEGRNFEFNQNKTRGYQYIAEASDLRKIENNKYDFIISSHTLEHIANPIKALWEFIRILKKGGCILIIVPDKDYTFDHRRDYTTIDHLILDYKNNVQEDDLTHVEEVLAKHDLALDPPAGNFKEFKERSFKNYENRCLHHHVFNEVLLKEMADYLNIRTILTYKFGNLHILGFFQNV